MYSALALCSMCVYMAQLIVCCVHLHADLRQINTFDQFHHVFDEIIAQHQTPTAICGYVSMASACHVAPLVKPGGLTSQAELDSIVKHLRDYTALMPKIKHAMQFVNQSRRLYIDAHRHAFPTSAQVTNYMRAWVANYEISDYFRHVGLKKRAAVDGVVFARFNQYSERGQATHEEKERILKEEACFGGAGTHDKGHVTSYKATDSVFIMEPFAPERKLLRPEQFLTESMSQPRVFVLDLNGIATLPCCVAFFYQYILPNLMSYLHNQQQASIIARSTNPDTLSAPTYLQSPTSHIPQDISAWLCQQLSKGASS